MSQLTLSPCLDRLYLRISAKCRCDTLVDRPHPVARKDIAMARHVLIATLLAVASTPALAASASRWGPDRCRIVNIAPHYTQTTIRKGKRVYITRELARQDMAIICKH